MRIVGLLAVTLGVVGCRDGARTAARTTPDPGPAEGMSSPPVASGDAVAPPVGDDQRVAFCIGGFEPGPDGNQRQECGLQPNRPWHLHGLVVDGGGLCYECWDEEDSDCEAEAPKAGYRYVGSDCGSHPPAAPGATHGMNVVR